MTIITNTRTRLAGVAGAALLAGALVAVPTAHAAVDVEGSASIRVQGIWTDMRPAGDGVCDYTATVGLRGTMDDGRRVRANTLPMTARSLCNNEIGIGDEFRGRGEVDVTGRAGKNGPVRVERATGSISLGAEPLDVTIGAVASEFLLEGDLLGRIDKATPKGNGVCTYSLTAQIDGVTSEGFRLRPARYTEVEWTYVLCSPDLTAGTRVAGTISGDVIGTTSGKWIDVLNFDGEAILVVDDVTHTGSASWSTSPQT